MVLTEKVKFNGVNTEISPGAVDNGGNRLIVNPIVYALNARYLSSEYGDELVAENIRGNTKITNANLPAGTNKCIGWGEDKENNCIYYFIYNSNSNHCIFKFLPETQAITLLIQSSALNFQNDRRYIINSVSCINGLIIWDDAYNETGCIKAGRSYTYAGFEESHIRLIKKQPSVAIKVNNGVKANNDGQVYYRSPEASVVSNLIADKNYQFSYRIVYLDKELSVLAPYSQLALGERYPELESQERAIIVVNFELSNAITYAEKIQVLYRGSTEDTWKVFANLDPISGSSYSVNFTGTEFIEEVPESESSKIFEAIPNYSSASCIQKNRLFLTEDESGFDTTHPTLNAQILPEEVYRTNILDRHWTPGGKKKIGLALFDKDQKSIGIVHSDNWDNVFAYTGIFNRQGIINHSTSTLRINSQPKTIVLFDKEAVRMTTVNDYVTLTSPGIGNGFTILIYGRVSSKNDSSGQIVINSPDYVNGAYSGQDISNWIVAISSQGYELALNNQYHPKVVLSGSFPVSGPAKYYSLAVSDDLFYDEYFEVPVRPYFYKFDKTGDYTIGATEVLLDGKVFTKQKPTSGDSYTKIYLQLPRETPIAVDDSFYVRLINGVSTPAETIRTEKILAVDGDWIVVNNFGVLNWSANSDTISGADNFIVKVAIFRLKSSEEVTRYYEVTPRYTINNDGTIPTSTFTKLQGDCYSMSNRYTFRSFRNNPAYQKKTTGIFTILSKSAIGSIATNAQRDSPKEKGAKKVARLLIQNRGLDEVSDVTERSAKRRLKAGGAFNASRFSGDDTDIKILNTLVASDGLSASARNYVVDYTMADWGKGIPLVEIEESKRIFRSGTKIRFSNKFIQDTNVNGLNSFDAGNAHSLSSERGKIKRLVPVGNNILAVHERACTTLYIEEGIIRGADGGGTLVTTSNVIGHDNKMILEYGAYHGESVVKNDMGHVFGFDVYKGVAWRYTNEGLAKISGDVDTDFQALGAEYLAIKDTCRIIGGIDPANKEYILTFLKNDGTGVTWYYNYEKNLWQGNLSFLGEMYANVGNNFIAFKNGELWIQNSSTTHNNFFGVQYNRVIKVAVNPYPGTKKVFNGIIIAAQKLSEDNNEVVARFYCGDQESYNMFDEFDLKQGLHMGPILRDINTPNMDPSLLALRDGDFLFGEYIIVEIATSLTERLPIRFFDVTYNKSEFSK